MTAVMFLCLRVTSEELLQLPQQLYKSQDESENGKNTVLRAKKTFLMMMNTKLCFNIPGMVLKIWLPVKYNDKQRKI